MVRTNGRTEGGWNGKSELRCLNAPDTCIFLGHRRVAINLTGTVLEEPVFNWSIHCPGSIRSQCRKAGRSGGMFFDDYMSIRVGKMLKEGTSNAPLAGFAPSTMISFR